MTVPERQISFTDTDGDKLTAKRTSAGEIMIWINDNECVCPAPVHAEQLAHCLLAWAKEVVKAEET